MDIPTHTVLALPYNCANATIAIKLDTSLPCAKGPKTPNVQLNSYNSAQSPEGGHERSASRGRSSRSSSRGRHTWIEVPPTIQTSQDIQVPVEAHHRTDNREDHHIEGDAAPLQTSIWLATLCLSIHMVKKTNFTQIGHLMAKESFHTTLQLVTKQGCKSLSW